MATPQAARERDIIADSLDIAMPGQDLQEVRAVRSAYAESPPDSTKIIVKEPDWIRGDTAPGAVVSRVAKGK